VLAICAAVLGILLPGLGAIDVWLPNQAPDEMHSSLEDSLSKRWPAFDIVVTTQFAIEATVNRKLARAVIRSWLGRGCNPGAPTKFSLVFEVAMVRGIVFVILLAAAAGSSVWAQSDTPMVSGGVGILGNTDAER
jgi:hypothetical protein